MSEGDQNSPPPEDVFETIGQWNPPLNDPGEVFQDVGHWENTGRISTMGNWESIDEEHEPNDKEQEPDGDPESLRNFLSTCETVNPINDFKIFNKEESPPADLEKFYEEAQKKWIGSKEFAASDQHRLPYAYYNRTVRIRFPKFSRGHKPGDFKEFIRRYVGGDRVKALGMLPLPNEWQMTVKDEKDRERLLRQKKMKIGSRNVWITPISGHEVRGMVHWLPMSVSNASIAAVLGNDGTVLFVETLDPTEKVELKHHSKGVRYFSMYLHGDKTPDDIPRVITVDGCKAFLGIPGRSPTCFHCRTEGHRKNECPIFNMMKIAHEKAPKPTVGRARKKKAARANKSTDDLPAVPYKGDLGIAGQGNPGISSQDNQETVGQGDQGNTGQGGSANILQLVLETAGQDDLGTSGQGGLESMDQGGLETKGQTDLENADQRGSATIGQGGIKTAGQDDLGTSSQGDQGTANQDDQGTEDPGDKETIGYADQGNSGQSDLEVISQSDRELTKNVEAMASAEETQVVQEKSENNLVDVEKYRDIVAELQNLENELQHALDETMDGLKEKMERGSRILHDLLSLK